MVILEMKVVMIMLLNKKHDFMIITMMNFMIFQTSAMCLEQ
jgi:hypothetical protein